MLWSVSIKTRTFPSVNTCNGSFLSCLKLLTQYRTIEQMCSDAHSITLNVYIVNHKGIVHDKQSLMFQVFDLRSVVLTQFKKSVGPCPALYKYNGDVVITLYCIVKIDCLAFKTNIFCIS